MKVRTCRSEQAAGPPDKYVNFLTANGGGGRMTQAIIAYIDLSNTSSTGKERTMKRFKKSITVWTIGLVVLFSAAELAAPLISMAAPNTGGTQKTAKQCKQDRTTCEKNCDKLIDIGNTIQRCKDLCTDDYLMCLPLRSSGQPGSKLEGVRPRILPDTNAPVLRGGLEGEPAPSSQPETPGNSNQKSQ